MKEEVKLLEAILLVASSPIKKSKLSKIIACDEHSRAENFDEVLNELKEALNEHGVQVIEIGDEIELVTRQEFAEKLKEFFKLESEELSTSLLEVLSLISYIGPISRSAIEKIRGVNSVYSLKRLLITGLVEKTEPSDIPVVAGRRPFRKNVILYKPSIEFLKYLGITNVESLPNYFEFRKKIIGQGQ